MYCLPDFANPRERGVEEEILFSLFLSLRPTHREPLELGQKEGTPVLPGVGLRFIPSTFPSPVHFDKPPQVRRPVLAYLALTALGSQFDWIPVT